MRDAIVRCAVWGGRHERWRRWAVYDFSAKKVGVISRHRDGGCGTRRRASVQHARRRQRLAAPAAAGAAPTFRDRAMYALRPFVVYAAVMQLFGGFFHGRRPARSSRAAPRPRRPPLGAAVLRGEPLTRTCS